MSDPVCDINDLSVRLTVAKPGACTQHAPGQTRRLNELLPHNMCIYLYNAIFPYYVTLTSGGRFKWVREGEGVLMQCPSPVGCVVTSVSQNEKGDGVVAKVIRVKGPCPKNHAVGDVLEITQEKSRFCLRALGGMIPYLLLRAKDRAFPWSDSSAVRCAGCDANFRLERETS